MTTSLAELASRAHGFVRVVAGGDSHFEEGGPILGLSQPAPSLGWLRCDPPRPPRLLTAGMPDTSRWAAVADRAYEAATRRTWSGSVPAGTEGVALQVLVAWAAVDELRRSPETPHDPARSLRRREAGLLLATRLIAPIPAWLSVRRKLAEWLLNLAEGTSQEVGGHLLLLFDEDPPANRWGPPEVSGWAQAVLALDLYRRRSPLAPSRATLHQALQRGLSREAIRDLEPELGAPPGPSPGGREPRGELEYFVRRSVRPLTLLGPSGSGKTRLAKQIHAWLGREKPFVHVNCHALSANLIEAELFGTEPGFATGVKKNQGAFERAGDGVLFLDEIGDAPVELLGKLLTAIEERQAYRVGVLRRLRSASFDWCLRLMLTSRRAYARGSSAQTCFIAWGACTTCPALPSEVRRSSVTWSVSCFATSPRGLRVKSPWCIPHPKT
ncbi:MAG: sigma 54-interacting transcriptional regulator [bacterium]